MSLSEEKWMTQYIDRKQFFKNRHPVTMDRKLENSVIDLKIELLKAKAENEKLAEQNQELKRKNELLQQELEKLNKRVSRKEISVLKKLVRMVWYKFFERMIIYEIR